MLRGGHGRHGWKETDEWIWEAISEVKWGGGSGAEDGPWALGSGPWASAGLVVVGRY